MSPGIRIYSHKQIVLIGTDLNDCIEICTLECCIEDGTFVGL